MAVEISIGYFLPIFSFLLVFIVLYAILSKTKILGENKSVMLFISFILSSFFIVESSLVEFVRLSSAWMVVLIFSVFFGLTLLAFLPGEKPLSFLTKGNWFSWIILGLIVGLFIISSAYVFDWAIDLSFLEKWGKSNVFGVVLILIVAALVSWRITK